MKLRELLMVMVSVAALGLLVQATPGLALDCFDAQCSVSGTTSSNPILYLSNYGAGDGLISYSQNGTGISAGSANGTGISAGGKQYGLRSSATGTSGGIIGVLGDARTSPQGVGVWAYGGKSGMGVYGEAYTMGTGVMGKGLIGVMGDGDHTGVEGAGSTGVVGNGRGASGFGGYFYNDAGGGGVFGRANTVNWISAVTGENYGSGYGVCGKSSNGIAGYFKISSTSNASSALQATTYGTGWAATFYGQTTTSSRGVYIRTYGGTALAVYGGTKSAVVPTSQGARSLYAEEASEVYFTDYGFGRLQNGTAVVAIDPLFAETVNLEQDYFVFLQPYGNAEIYVGRTGSKDFEVCLRGGDAQAKFAYRVVGKRKGFEQARLEHAP